MNVQCDQTQDCQDHVPAYIDPSGWAYCARHGVMHKTNGRQIRKLRPAEVKKLERGETITRY